MAKAKKLASGRWRALVYNGKKPDGTRDYISITADTEAKANYLAEQQKKHHLKVSRDASALTLGEAIDRYLEERDGILSPTTIRSYKAVRKNRLPGLMGIRLNKLNRNQIQRAINEEAKTHSPKTVRNIYGLLTAAVGEFAPDLYRDLQSKHAITLPNKIEQEQHILEPDELAHLLAAVCGTVMEIPVLLAVWLGMRQSEVTGLTWECIDFDRGTVRIKQALVRNSNNQYELKTTKTRTSTRTVQLPAYLSRVLCAEKEHLGKDVKPEDFVVKLSAQSLYRRLQTILKHNSLPPIRFHDLRHCNASIMLALGVPDKYAQKRGGWASNYTMKRVYSHLMEGKRSDVDNTIDQYFDSLIQENATQEATQAENKQ